MKLNFSSVSFCLIFRLQLSTVYGTVSVESLHRCQGKSTTAMTPAPPAH